VDRFIEKNRRYRIEPITKIVAVGGRQVPFASQCIQELDSAD
jgi:hypothetical protein